jgi:ABC-type bacteriocin/lantibiotic exporter with double-glycine peptidase domain
MDSVRTGWVLPIVKAVGKGLNVELDVLQLQHDHESLMADVAVDWPSFLDHLSEVGASASISFFENNATPQQFASILSNSLVPAVAFLNEPGKGAQPFVITAVGGKRLEGYVLDASGELATKRTFSIADAAQHLLGRDALEQAAQHPGTEHKPGSSVFFLTTLSVGSLVTYPNVEEDKKNPNSFTPVARLWHILASERKDISYIYIYAIISGLLGLTLPLGVQTIMNIVAGGLILEPVVILISLVVLGIIVGGVLQIMQSYIVENLQQRVFARAAFELSMRVPRMKLEALGKDYPPELANRFFDVLNIQKGFAKLLTDFISAALQIIFGMLLLTFYHPYFIFFSLGMILLLFLIFRYTGPEGMRTSLQESKYKYKAAHWVQELARNILSFKVAPDAKLPVDKMDHLVSGYLQKRQKHFKVLVKQYSAVLAFKVLVVGGLLVLGSILVVNRQITLGQFVASELVIVLVLASIEKIMLSLDVIYDTLTAVEKVGQVTDMPLDRSQGISLSQHGTHTGFAIRTKHLNYRYPGTAKAVLQDINLDIAPGQRVGILASQGAGVGTLLQVLGGMLPAYEGVITFNGISMRDLHTQSLQRNMGLCMGENEIFPGTLYENIALGRRHLTLQDVAWAMQQVELSDFAEKLPQGMQTELAAAGWQLPGHVIKKIILARAIVDRPSLLLIDEFLNRLEGGYLAGLKRLILDRANPWTVVALSHDPVFLRQCDHIIVLHQGGIAKRGTFSEIEHDPLVQKLLSADGVTRVL